MDMQFYICEHCKNIIAFVDNKGVPIMCCGQKMNKLEANTVDAAQEKHVPVIKTQGNDVTVTVGDVLHPMLPEHSIEWIALETKQGNQRKKITQEPTAMFSLCNGDEPRAAFAYCNLHGLWKQEV